MPENEWFTPAMLLRKCPQLRAVIDLSATKNTASRYNPQDFIDANVEHFKIIIEGGDRVPGMSQIRRFLDVVDGFVKKFSDNPDALIGVHCTHGINRTGFFICNYMVMKMDCESKNAIAKFQKARGHDMYRKNLIRAILEPGSQSELRRRPDYRRPSHSDHPVQHPPTNWRIRNPEIPPVQESDWVTVQSRSRRRFDYGPTTSRRMSSNQTNPNVSNREYSQRGMEYGSPLDDVYEHSYRTSRHGPYVQRNLNRRT